MRGGVPNGLAVELLVEHDEEVVRIRLIGVAEVHGPAPVRRVAAEAPSSVSRVTSSPIRSR